MITTTKRGNIFRGSVLNIGFVTSQYDQAVYHSFLLGYVGRYRKLLSLWAAEQKDIPGGKHEP